MLNQHKMIKISRLHFENVGGPTYSSPVGISEHSDVWCILCFPSSFARPCSLLRPRQPTCAGQESKDPVGSEAANSSIKGKRAWLLSSLSIGLAAASPESTDDGQWTGSLFSLSLNVMF